MNKSHAKLIIPLLIFAAAAAITAAFLLVPHPKSRGKMLKEATESHGSAR
ncbi:MAG: hypothetical protein IKQ91_05505 [Oscillospiraceae bacterium]|nr:hypothetical protein [Oscillospiraceae bacterium]